MQRIAISTSDYGFIVSKLGREWLAARGNEWALKELERLDQWRNSDKESLRRLAEHNEWSFYEGDRNDPILIECLETLGADAMAETSKFGIVEIPDGVDWQVWSGDLGPEWVAEKHRSWRFEDGKTIERGP